MVHTKWVKSHVLTLRSLLHFNRILDKSRELISQTLIELEIMSENTESGADLQEELPQLQVHRVLMGRPTTYVETDESGDEIFA